MTADRSKTNAALVAAVTAGNAAEVRALLDQGADPNARNNQNEPVLSIAAEKNLPDIVTLLLDHHADIDAYGGMGKGITALGEAAYAGHVEVARILIEHHADVNRRSGDMTPVGWASAQRGNVDIVRMLIDHGADVNTPGLCNQTPLIEAAVYGKQDAADELVRHAANVNAIGNLGGTALKWASYHNHAGIVQLLVDNGADIDVKDSEGETPLMAAKKRQSREAVAILRGVFDARARRAAEAAEEQLLQLVQSSKVLDHDMVVQRPIRLKLGA